MMVMMGVVRQRCELQSMQGAKILRRRGWCSTLCQCQWLCAKLGTGTSQHVTDTGRSLAIVRPQLRRRKTEKRGFKMQNILQSST
jgi:hypothetical protein